MKHVLIIIHNNTYFNGLLPVALCLKETKEYEPIFLFRALYPTLANELAKCQVEGFRFVLSGNAALVNRTPVSDTVTISSITHRRWTAFIPLPVKRALKQSLIYAIRNPLYETWLLWRKIKSIRQLIRTHSISIMVLPADNRYDQAAYVQAAHLEHKPVIVVPQFMAGPLEWAEYVWDKAEYWLDNGLNRIAGRVYPRWIREHKGRKLIGLPASQIFAREWLGIAPPLPWVLHSGFTDALALEGEAVRDYCIEEGLPSPALYVIGSGAHDILANGLRNVSQKRVELCKSLGLPSDRPVLLSALTPDAFYMTGPTKEFNTYGELVEFWCRSLAAIDGWNAIVCLHPSVETASMKYIEEWGVRIADEPTIQLIPLCDIFVASISATIQWAIACGKPVVNYDVHRYRYTDYVGVGGVILVEEKNEFQQVLGRLTSDPGFYTEISARQSAYAQRWGRLDGKAGERLLELFDVMIDRYSGVKT